MAAQASKAFGERLAVLRARRTQREVGEVVGVSGSAVGQWEKGITTPPADTVFALEDYFGCAPGELALLLGYGRPDLGEPEDDRLSQVEVRLDRLEAKMDLLLERLPPVGGSR